MNRIERAWPIIDLIYKHESRGAAAGQGVESEYDVVWGSIKPADRPLNRLGRPLTSLTVDQVLRWQDDIDPLYMSEAAGAPQILEDTMRGLDLDPDRLYDKSCQDEAALMLLDRRGWERCEAGRLSVPDFADQLAREWASLPVVRPQKGHTRPVRAGQSYYAGDGRNFARATPVAVLGAIRKALALDVPRPVPRPGPDAELVAWLRDAPAGLRDWLAQMPAEIGAE